jgi:hypothetical protein
VRSGPRSTGCGEEFERLDHVAQHRQRHAGPHRQQSSVPYTPPEGGDVQQVVRFTTQRPSFATDNLFQQLQSTDVPVNANPPDAGPPVWQQLLLGFGPTILLIWLLVRFSRRAGGGAGGVLGSFGRRWRPR